MVMPGHLAVLSRAATGRDVQDHLDTLRAVIIKICLARENIFTFVSYQSSALSLRLHTTQLVFGLVCGSDSPRERHLPRCSPAFGFGART